jgi:hypothetical protein
MSERTTRIGAGRLLGRIVAAAAVVVGCLIGAVATDSTALLVAAVVVLIAATATIARAGEILLADADGGDARVPPRRATAVARDRWTVAAVGGVAVIAVAGAIALSHGDARATATTPATAATAARAVRSFLSDAVLEDDAYGACQYLAPVAQRAVTRIAGDGQTCRDALTATQPAFAGITSVGDLRALRLRVTIRHGAALVRAAAPGAPPPAAFLLRPATSAETDAFRAPACAWRIVAGVAAVLPGGRRA